MDKIIFLDIDGVLNSKEFYGDNIDNYNAEIDFPDCDIDQNAVNTLKEIVLKTNAKVVISSTWRHNYYAFLVARLGKEGIEVISKTGKNDCSDCVRGNLIAKWLNDNGYNRNFDRYVILDDDRDMLLCQKNNFIHIDSKFGLDSCYVDSIVKILNGVR
jgi:hypothetical protein